MPEQGVSPDQECFFTAPIGDEGSADRDRSDGVLEFIVARAAGELGLVAVRGDQLAAPGQITIQVLAHVLRARAAVADLTGKNPNVFYELAVRHTARLPTVLICDRSETLPFDIAQMRTIMFDHTDLRSADMCRRAIVAHLREAFDGAVDSPIATAIDVTTLQAGNTMERRLAELVTSVEELSKAQKDILTIVRGITRSRGSLTGAGMPSDREILEAVHGRLSKGKPLDEGETASVVSLLGSVLTRVVESEKHGDSITAVVPYIDEPLGVMLEPDGDPSA